MDKLELKQVLPYLDNMPEGLAEEKITFRNGSFIDKGKYALTIGNLSDMIDQGHFDKIKLCLRPLSDLTKDTDTLYEMAILADCHFKERLQVEHYKLYIEDGVQICQVHWVDRRNDFFEFSFGMDLALNKEIDIKNDNISMSLNSLGMIHNPYRIYQLLFSKHYDTEMLIKKGLAIDINSL